MDEKQIDLDDDAFRRVPAKPLGPRKALWQGIFWFGLASIIGALASWRLGTWWAAFLPIPCAIWVGVGLAGLFPHWFFGNSD